MYSIVKWFLFLFYPETSHKIAMNLLKYSLNIPLINQLFTYEKIEPIEFAGILFKNKLGLAAGFDKNAEYVEELSKIGFGHIEIGTVTPLPQEGNPKPRSFRLKNDQALLNRMGFNNQGSEKIVQNLKKYSGKNIVIGGNIGKNKWTPNEEAHLDYLKCFQALFLYVDYFVVNVSSPNTPNLRELQDKSMLIQIFESLYSYRDEMGLPKPIFLKIAPDLNETQLDEIIDVYHQIKIDALIVSNTTIDYSVIKVDNNIVDREKTGGISGRVIAQKSNEVIQYLKSKNAQIKIIGVGGIDDKSSADDKIELGCELVQVYTGFIYKGQNLIKEILS